jgi:uncharacterized protein DUF547
MRFLVLVALVFVTGAEASDHAQLSFDSLLVRYVRDGRVAYSVMAVDPLIGRCEAAFAMRHDTTRNKGHDKLTYWINAYNFTVIASVIRQGIPRNVMKVPGFFKTGNTVNGETLTLDEIENKIIRPMGDPRIHAALVCAASSCPKLPSRAYDSSILDAQLDKAAREFLVDTTRNVISLARNTLRLSKVFEWFSGDFNPRYGSVKGFILAFGPVSKADSTWLKETPINWIEYDWTLNGE